MPSHYLIGCCFFFALFALVLIFSHYRNKAKQRPNVGALLMATVLLGCIASTPIMADAHFYTLGHKKISLSSLQGKWVLINYWASWCTPCLEEIEALNRFYVAHRSSVEVYAVNLDAPAESRQRFLQKKLGILYPGLSKDPGSELGFETVRGVPATFVINPQGKLADTVYGGQTMASLEALINSK